MAVPAKGKIVKRILGLIPKIRLRFLGRWSSIESYNIFRFRYMAFTFM